MNPNKSISCPSCSAEHTLTDPSTISFVCEYCDNVIVWDEQGLKLSGKQSRLVEGFSRLYRGAMGEIAKQRFQVLGRIRYSFGRGFWDEWYLMLETGETIWLTEDNHEFSRQIELDHSNAFGHPSDYLIGDDIQIDGTVFRVQEIGKAKCLGIEGALPKGILPDEEYDYVDGSSLNGRQTFGLEYDGVHDGFPPTLYVGTWLEPHEIKLDDEDVEW